MSMLRSPSPEPAFPRKFTEKEKNVFDRMLGIPGLPTQLKDDIEKILEDAKAKNFEITSEEEYQKFQAKLFELYIDAYMAGRKKNIINKTDLKPWFKELQVIFMKLRKKGIVQFEKATSHDLYEKIAKAAGKNASLREYMITQANNSINYVDPRSGVNALKFISRMGEDARKEWNGLHGGDPKLHLREKDKDKKEKFQVNVKDKVIDIDVGTEDHIVHLFQEYIKLDSLKLPLDPKFEAFTAGINEYQIVNERTGKIETAAASEAGVLALLGEDGRKVLQGGIEEGKGKEKSARELFFRYLAGVSASPLRYKFKGNEEDDPDKYPEKLDPRKANPEKQAIKMLELLGPYGLRLYEEAVAEEAESIAFRDAAFLISTGHNPSDVEWNKKEVILILGPSACGKSTAIKVGIKEANEIIRERLAQGKKTSVKRIHANNPDNLLAEDKAVEVDKKIVDINNITVSKDGEIGRKVSQMRQMVLQVAKQKGYPGIKDVDKYTDLDIKAKVEEAAAIKNKLNIVIPDTFTKYWLPPPLGLSSKNPIDKYSKEANVDLVFIEVVPGKDQDLGKDPDERFQNTVYRFGNGRAWCKDFSEKETTNYQMQMNNRDLGFESKAYDAGFGGLKFSKGVDIQKEAKKRYIEQCAKYKKTPIIISVFLDVLFMKRDETTNKWRECGKSYQGPVKAITARAYREFIVAQEQPGFNFDQWYKAYENKEDPFYTDPLIEVTLGKDVIKAPQTKRPALQAASAVSSSPSAASSAAAAILPPRPASAPLAAASSSPAPVSTSAPPLAASSSAAKSKDDIEADSAISLSALLGPNTPSLEDDAMDPASEDVSKLEAWLKSTEDKSNPSEQFDPSVIPASAPVVPLTDDSSVLFAKGKKPLKIPLIDILLDEILDVGLVVALVAEKYKNLTIKYSEEDANELLDSVKEYIVHQQNEGILEADLKPLFVIQNKIGNLIFETVVKTQAFTLPIINDDYFSDFNEQSLELKLEKLISKLVGLEIKCARPQITADEKISTVLNIIAVNNSIISLYEEKLTEFENLKSDVLRNDPNFGILTQKYESQITLYKASNEEYNVGILASHRAEIHAWSTMLTELKDEIDKVKNELKEYKKSKEPKDQNIYGGLISTVSRLQATVSCYDNYLVNQGKLYPSLAANVSQILKSNRGEIVALKKHFEIDVDVAAFRKRKNFQAILSSEAINKKNQLISAKEDEYFAKVGLNPPTSDLDLGLHIMEIINLIHKKQRELYHPLESFIEHNPSIVDGYISLHLWKDKYETLIKNMIPKEVSDFIIPDLSKIKDEFNPAIAADGHVDDIGRSFEGYLGQKLEKDFDAFCHAHSNVLSEIDGLSFSKSVDKNEKDSFIFNDKGKCADWMALPSGIPELLADLIKKKMIEASQLVHKDGVLLPWIDTYFGKEGNKSRLSQAIDKHKLPLVREQLIYAVCNPVFGAFPQKYTGAATVVSTLVNKQLLRNFECVKKFAELKELTRYNFMAPNLVSLLEKKVDSLLSNPLQDSKKLSDLIQFTINIISDPKKENLEGFNNMATRLSNKKQNIGYDLIVKAMTSIISKQEPIISKKGRDAAMALVAAKEQAARDAAMALVTAKEQAVRDEAARVKVEKERALLDADAEKHRILREAVLAGPAARVAQPAIELVDAAALREVHAAREQAKRAELAATAAREQAEQAARDDALALAERERVAQAARDALAATEREQAAALAATAERDRVAKELAAREQAAQLEAARLARLKPRPSKSAAKGLGGLAASKKPKVSARSSRPATEEKEIPQEHMETITKVLLQFIAATTEKFSYDKSARSMLKDLGLYNFEKATKTRTFGKFFKPPLSETITSILPKAHTEARTLVRLPKNVIREESKEEKSPAVDLSLSPSPSHGLEYNRIKDKRLPKGTASDIITNTLVLDTETASYSEQIDADDVYKLEALELVSSLKRSTIFSSVESKSPGLLKDFPGLLNDSSEVYGLITKELIEEYLNASRPPQANENEILAQQLYEAFRETCRQNIQIRIAGKNITLDIVADDYLIYADRMVESLLSENGPNADITVTNGTDPLIAESLMIVCAAKGLIFKTEDRKFDYERYLLEHKNEIKHIQENKMGKVDKKGNVIVSKVIDVEIDSTLTAEVDKMRKESAHSVGGLKKAMNFVDKIKKGVNLLEDEREDIKIFLQDLNKKPVPVNKTNPFASH